MMSYVQYRNASIEAASFRSSGMKTLNACGITPGKFSPNSCFHSMFRCRRIGVVKVTSGMNRLMRTALKLFPSTAALGRGKKSENRRRKRKYLLLMIAQQV